MWLAVATVAAALLVVATFLTVGRGPRASTVRSFPSPAVPLTAYPGFELVPSLSPDGSRIAFSWNGPTLDNYDIYVKLAGPGEPVRLTRNPAADESPAWSPDGRLIAFLRVTSDFTADGSETAADLIVIPSLGGAERIVAAILQPPIPRHDWGFSNLSWTPDGRWLAFGGTTSASGSKGIWLISVDGSEQRRLTEAPEGVSREMGPVVSPDGRHVAFLRGRTLSRNAIFLLPVTSDWRPAGTPRRLIRDDHAVLGLAWTETARTR